VKKHFTFTVAFLLFGWLFVGVAVSPRKAGVSHIAPYALRSTDVAPACSSDGFDKSGACSAVGYKSSYHPPLGAERIRMRSQIMRSVW